MPITPTHDAENRHTGEKVQVEYDEKTNQYKESFMIAIIEKQWIITPIEKGANQ